MALCLWGCDTLPCSTVHPPSPLSLRAGLCLLSAPVRPAPLLAPASDALCSGGAPRLMYVTDVTLMSARLTSAGPDNSTRRRVCAVDLVTCLDCHLELTVVSSRLAGCEHRDPCRLALETPKTGYGSPAMVTGHGSLSQAAGHMSQVTGLRSQNTGHRPPNTVTGHRSQVTRHGLHHWSPVKGHGSRVIGQGPQVKCKGHRSMCIGQV